MCPPPPLPPNSCVEFLTSDVTVFGDGDLKKISKVSEVVSVGP